MRCTKCGSNVGAGIRFCTECGNVMEADDSVVRIIDDELAVSNRKSLIGSSKMNSALLLKRINWRSKKTLSIVAVIVSIIFLSVILSKILNKGEVDYGGFVLMEKENQGTRELYLGVPGKEEVRLAAGVDTSPFIYSYILTRTGSKKFLYCSEEGDLFEVDEQGNSEKVAEGVNKDYRAVSYDLKKYLFITSKDSTLYIKESGKEKVQIDSDVQGANFLGDKEIIIYRKNNGEVFVRNSNGEVNKILDGANLALMFGAEEGIVVIKDGNKVVYKNLKTGEEQVVKEYKNSEFNDVIQDIAEKGLYDKEHIIYQDEDKLYYLKMGEKAPIEIASGVISCDKADKLVVYENTKGKWYGVKIGETKSYTIPDLKTSVSKYYHEGYLIYKDYNGALYRAELGSDRGEKLNDYITGVYPTEKELYFMGVTDIRTLYKVGRAGVISKVEDRVSKAYVVGNSYLAYLTTKGDLYVDGQVYSNVSQCATVGKNVCFIDKDNAIHMIHDKERPKKVIENVGEYSNIYYGEKFLMKIKALMNGTPILGE